MVENRDSVLHFHEYFRVIRNRLWVIFTIFILTVLSGTYVTEQVLPKVYTASSSIQLLSDRLSTVTGSDVHTQAPFDPTAFQSEFKIIQSPPMLIPIIQDLGLEKTWGQRLYKANVPLTDTQAYDYMTSILRLDPERGTNIIIITASSQDPKEAADIVNAVADHYLTARAVEQNKLSNQGTEALLAEMKQKQKAVDERKALVQDLLEKAAQSGTELQAQAQTDRLETDLQQQKQNLLTAKEDYDARRVLLEKVQSLSDAEYVATLNAMGRLDNNISALRTENFKIEGDIENLLKDGFEAKHPRILAMQAEIERKRKQISELIVGTRSAMGIDVQMSQSKVALLEKEVADLTAKIRQAQSSAVVPFRQAQHDLEVEQGMLEALKYRYSQAKTDERIMLPPVKIISRAEPPAVPSSPNKKLYMGISIMGGLFLGLVVAFLIEYLDTSVKTMADAESLLGLPVLTVIPNKGGPMPLTQDSSSLPHAEGYRILRAKLDLKVVNGVGPSLTMLSGGPGEGKSTTVYNLAVVCAQSGNSVILVDCDLRRPTVHSLTNVSNERGVANYLRGEGEAVEYVQQTAIPKLHVLASGDIPLSEIGVLAGDKIRAMLEDLKQRYDLVLVDSPPVLGISDGSIIAREVDYVILVIQHRRYPKEISLRAKRAIEEVHGNCVGMVLNCVSVKSDDSYYYYSNYGNYYKKIERTKKRKSEQNGEPAAANGKGSPGRAKDLESDEF